MTASTGPLSSTPLPGMTQAYITPQVTVQIRKKLAMGTPDDAPPYRASEATTLPQYANPISTVTTDDQRNHHRARDINAGRTLPLVAASISAMNGKLTRLKKYSNPIQITPATICTKRNIISRLMLKSDGRLISITVGSSSETDD